MYDVKDTGLVTKEQFVRILSIFFENKCFDDVEKDIEFLCQVPTKRGNMIDYRDFCKFLSKRVVRGFKHIGDSESLQDKNQMKEL